MKVRVFIEKVLRRLTWQNFKKGINYYREHGLLSTFKIIARELNLHKLLKFKNSKPPKNRLQKVNRKNYRLARSFLSTGYLNALWYGGEEHSSGLHTIPKEELLDSESERILLEVNRFETVEILARYGSGVGTGVNRDFLSLLPLTDIEAFLKDSQALKEVQLSKDRQSFSVITTFFKHYAYFMECAISVMELLTASYPEHIEWIIINDDPEYDAEALFECIPEELKPYTRLYSDGKNLGITRRINEGILYSKHDWLLFLDCDDRICPQAINVIASYIDRFPLNRYISSSMIDIDENNQVLRFRVRRSGPEKLITEGMIAGHLKAIRRDLFEDYGFLDEVFDGVQDYEFVLRTVFNEPILFIPEYLYCYRFHGVSQSVQASAKQTRNATSVVYKYARKFLFEAPNRKFEQTHIERDTGLIQGASKQLQNGVVIIRTLGNRLDYLIESIESILVQQVAIKIIVVVHGNAGTFNMVRTAVIAEKNDIEVLHASDTNRFRGYPINVALRHLYASQDEYGFLAFLDDDDVFYPMFASTMLATLSVSNADVIYAASNKRIPGKSIEHGYRPLPIACLLLENFIPINSYCVRYEKLKSQKLFMSEELDYLEDWDFLVRMIEHEFVFHAVDNVLSEFRLTGDGNLVTKQFPDKWMQCRNKVQQKIDNTCKKLGRKQLYSMLINHGPYSIIDFNDYEKQFLKNVKVFIDHTCPISLNHGRIEKDFVEEDMRL